MEKKMGIGRREFIGAGAVSLFAGNLLARPAEDEVTFCAFADIHYYPGMFPHDTREWLERRPAARARTPGATLQGGVSPAASLRLLPEHPHRAGPCGTPATPESVQRCWNESYDKPRQRIKKAETLLCQQRSI